MHTFVFVASKLIGALVWSHPWIVIARELIVLTQLLQQRHLAMWTSSVTLATLFALAILPLGDLLLPSSERTYPAQPPLERDIVLGGPEDARANAYCS